MKWLLLLVLVSALGAGVLFQDDISRAIAAGGGGGQFRMLQSLGHLGDAIADAFRRGFGGF